MTRREWLEGLKDPAEEVFRVARGCQNCAFYVPDTERSYVCVRPDYEVICRREHAQWLNGEME